MAIGGCSTGNESIEEEAELKKCDLVDDFFLPELRGYFRTVFRSKRESMADLK